VFQKLNRKKDKQWWFLDKEGKKEKVQWSLVNEKHCNLKWCTPCTKLSRVNKSNLQLIEPPLV
jgi:hypothetical protein